MPEYLTIALSKGTLLKPTLALLNGIGLPTGGIDADSRNMVFAYEEESVQYIMCRPTDVPTYVEQGAADLGIVGKDVIMEQGQDVFELVDLEYGYCRFVVAAPAHMPYQGIKDLNYRRVATKFPVMAEKFFRSQGLQVEIINLHGNVELAPLTGIADMIVDLVSTGQTLRENQLAELVRIMDSTTRLISNRVSYRTKHDLIQPLIEKIQDRIKGGMPR